MKKTRTLAAVFSLLAILTIGLAGCSSKSSKSGVPNKQVSNKTTKKADAKSTLTKSTNFGM